MSFGSDKEGEPLAEDSKWGGLENFFQSVRHVLASIFLALVMGIITLSLSSCDFFKLTDAMLEQQKRALHVAASPLFDLNNARRNVTVVEFDIRKREAPDWPLSYEQLTRFVQLVADNGGKSLFVDLILQLERASASETSFCDFAVTIGRLNGVSEGLLKPSSLGCIASAALGQQRNSQDVEKLTEVAGCPGLFEGASATRGIPSEIRRSRTRKFLAIARKNDLRTENSAPGLHMPVLLGATLNYLRSPVAASGSCAGRRMVILDRVAALTTVAVALDAGAGYRLHVDTHDYPSPSLSVARDIDCYQPSQKNDCEATDRVQACRKFYPAPGRNDRLESASSAKEGAQQTETRLWRQGKCEVMPQPNETRIFWSDDTDPQQAGWNTARSADCSPQVGGISQVWQAVSPRAFFASKTAPPGPPNSCTFQLSMEYFADVLPLLKKSSKPLPACTGSSAENESGNPFCRRHVMAGKLAKIDSDNISTPFHERLPAVFAHGMALTNLLADSSPKQYEPFSKRAVNIETWSNPAVVIIVVTFLELLRRFFGRSDEEGRFFAPWPTTGVVLAFILFVLSAGWLVDAFGSLGRDIEGVRQMEWVYWAKCAVHIGFLYLLLVSCCCFFQAAAERLKGVTGWKWLERVATGWRKKGIDPLGGIQKLVPHLIVLLIITGLVICIGLGLAWYANVAGFSLVAQLFGVYAAYAFCFRSELKQILIALGVPGDVADDSVV